jgi:hypothetical protein
MLSIFINSKFKFKYKLCAIVFLILNNNYYKRNIYFRWDVIYQIIMLQIRTRVHRRELDHLKINHQLNLCLIQVLPSQLHLLIFRIR